METEIAIRIWMKFATQSAWIRGYRACFDDIHCSQGGVTWWHCVPRAWLEELPRWNDEWYEPPGNPLMDLPRTAEMELESIMERLHEAEYPIPSPDHGRAEAALRGFLRRFPIPTPERHGRVAEKVVPAGWDEPPDPIVIARPTTLKDRHHGDQVRWLVESCPYCGKAHLHSPEPGHRIAHCHEGGYKLVTIAEGGTVEDGD